MSFLFHLVAQPAFLFLIALPAADTVAVPGPDSTVTLNIIPAPVILRFGGDCLLASHYEEAAGDSFTLAFDGFSLLSDADFSMVNLECPVTTRGTKAPKAFNFRMKPAYLEAVRSAGITVVNIANNHIFDYGKEGLFDTISYLDSLGIPHVGAGRNSEEAYHAFACTVNNRTIALLGFYGGGEAPGATEKSGGVARRDLPTILREVKKLRVADSLAYVIVSLHWGTEKAEFPDAGQQSFARALIDGGVNAVIGHHPHVLQGIERYRNGVIAYSLGNFIFGGNSRDNYDTGVFEIRLTDSGPEYAFIPVAVRGWNAKVLQSPEADRLLTHVQKLSSIFSHSIFNIKEQQKCQTD